MRDYEINIKPNGISIRYTKTRALYDTDGNPVEIEDGIERVALGVGDVAKDPNAPTKGEMKAFRAKADELLVSKLGKTLRELIEP